MTQEILKKANDLHADERQIKERLTYLQSIEENPEFFICARNYNIGINQTNPIHNIIIGMIKHQLPQVLIDIQNEFESLKA
jgi:hypothetical protein